MPLNMKIMVKDKVSEYMIEWKDSYDIGVEKIDCQHRQLLVKLNEFLMLARTRKAKKRLKKH